ncbi:MAG TPA: hypothetical protein VFM32_03925 [Spongiibacteraceae bacterium]|nr:hypothetical protein [Spongiibacteraceae bacterium]
MLFKAVRCFLMSTLCLSACSDKHPIVIEPGKFSEDWPTALRKELLETNKCAADEINNIRTSQQQAFVFKSGDTLEISGWIFSKSDGSPAEVYVQLVGPALTYTALAQKRTARADVNQYFKLDPSWDTGYELQATQSAEAGEYKLEVLQPGPHGIAQCRTNLSLKIEPRTER